MLIAANKKKINNPVLVWNKNLPTYIFTYLHLQTSRKQTLLITLFALYKLRNVPTNCAWPVAKTTSIELGKRFA